MAASAATVGLGTLFKKGSNTIAEVVSIDGPGLEKAMVEATHLNSDSRFREFLSGLRDAGEITLVLNFLPADTTHEELEDAYLANTSASYSITWTDSGLTVWSFTAFVTGLRPNATLDNEPLRSTVTLKLTGIPTLV